MVAEAVERSLDDAASSGRATACSWATAQCGHDRGGLPLVSPHERYLQNDNFYSIYDGTLISSNSAFLSDSAPVHEPAGHATDTLGVDYLRTYLSYPT
jgi:hypothetical protein